MDKTSILKQLSLKHNIPIHEIKTESSNIVLYTNNGSKIASVPFYIDEGKTKLTDTTSLLNKENWNTLINDSLSEINSELSATLGRKDIVVYTLDPYILEITDLKENFICYLKCSYEEKKWHFSFKENLELAKLKHEVHNLKNEQKNNTVDPQNAFLFKGMEIGAQLFETYIEGKSKSENQLFELDNSFEREELKIVNDLDKRDKWYKGIMLAICIAALSGLAIYGKASSVAPVIGVVIGLVLQNNIITEYFTGSGKKKKIKSNIDFD